MSNSKKIRDELRRAAAHAGETARTRIRSAGDAINRVDQKRIREKIGTRSQGALASLGKTLENNAPRWGSKFQKFLDAKSDKSGTFLTNHINRLGRKTQQLAPVVGTTAGGAVTGLIKASGGLCDLSISPTELDEMETRLAEAAKRGERLTTEQNEIIKNALEHGDKDHLFDTLTVGGITLAAALQDPRAVPQEIEQAFALAYPRLAESGTSFSDAITDKSAEQLVGLVSGVKGKLFEMQLVDQLNSGQLDHGQQAVLAQSPTQEGYDIQIYDENGTVVEELQAKATDSVGYVQDALDRYPAIDIVTTSEVYGDLLSFGTSADILNSGISEADLHGHIVAASSATSTIGIEDFAPSALGLAFIAYLAFSKADIPLELRGAEFGERSAQTAVASSLGAGAILATGVGALGVIVGIGSHSAANIGSQRRQRYEALKEVTERLEASNEKTATRLHQSRRQPKGQPKEGFA